MVTDRVIAIIETHVNAAGIKEAQAGFGGLNVSTMALAAALGGLVLIGKSAIENYRAQEDALLGLQQATDATGRKYEFAKGVVEDFITTNKAYVNNQYDVITAYAKAIRAGNTQTDSVRLLNDALDLSVIKHEDVSEAMKALILAENGNGRALKELGISATDYSKIMKDKTLTDAQKHAKLLALIETKTKDGRKAVDDLTKAQNALNINWQALTTKAGPGLVGMLTGIVGWINQAYDALDRIGRDDALWARINDRLVKMADWIHTYILQPLADAYKAAGGRDVTDNAPAPNTGAPGGYHRNDDPFAGAKVGVRGAGSKAPVVVHNYLVIDGRALDVLSNAQIRRARFAPGV